VLECGTSSLARPTYSAVRPCTVGSNPTLPSNPKDNMTTYRRKQQHTIEAVQFTPEMGEAARGVRPDAVPDGLEYSEHTGYLYCGFRLAFGDYMLTGSRVPVERAGFEANWEPVPSALPAPEPYPPAVMQSLAEAKAREAEAIEASGLGGINSVVRGDVPSTGSVAVDTVLASKPKAPRKRTETPE
jgi:hypothetical protein